MFFNNPYGFLALLGIPVVLAIHFFQRRAKQLPVSTLFLLHQTQRESASGRRFERLLHSVPLWLQMLMVLLLTWLLIEPRYSNSASTQRIAIVLDSSASMAVFKKEIQGKLESELDSLQGLASGAEYFLLDSNPSNPSIYHGENASELFSAFADWQPMDGAHDHRHSLRMARSMVGIEGAVVYVTDTPVDSLQYGAHLYAVGHQVANCGVTGVEFSEKDGELIWQATVKNYSKEGQSREWFLELSSGARSEARTVELPAGGVVLLQGKFPEGSKRCRIELSEDAFSMDDQLSMVRPEPKQIHLNTAANSGYQEFAAKLVESFGAVTLAQDVAEVDAVITSSAALEGVDSNAVVFAESQAKSGSYLKGTIVAEEHPLMDGLNWQSLLVKEVKSIAHTAHDEVLLWQGERALIFLRSQDKSQLIFNFDLHQTNAEKQEAFAVLIWRFFEQIRAKKVAYTAGVVEAGQALEIARRADVESKELKLQEVDLTGKVQSVSQVLSYEDVRVPKRPGFFSIFQADEELFSGASYFADTREADFSECSTAEKLSTNVAVVVDKHSHEDWLWRYFLAFLLLAILVSWCYTGRGNLNQPVKIS